MLIGWLFRHRRVYVGRHRIHHGRFGKWLAVIGLALMLDDLFDWPWPFDR